jgi:hypothetical protein
MGDIECHPTGVAFRRAFYRARVRVWFLFIFWDVACLGIR